MSDARKLIENLLSILSYKQILPPMNEGAQDRMIRECRAVLDGPVEPHFLKELCEALGWQGGTFHQALTTVRLAVEALKDANSLCRSAHSIAERSGESTGWEAFLKAIKASLERQHAVMYPVDGFCTATVADVIGTVTVADGEAGYDGEAQNQTLTVDELTAHFRLVRGQRNNLLRACEKALAAFDTAQEFGRGYGWGGKDVDKMRAAVAATKGGAA